MRIVFMGTPDFSVPTLEALVKGGHEVLAVVTQPDKPKGRGKSVLMTPVKEKALELGIPVYQPVKVREPEFMEVLKGLDAEAFVVVAFGQILPKEILEMPRYGCVNVHASLLPRYRGAAPIQWAVIDGEAVSGVTTMLMDEGLDTGDMLEKAEIPLDKEETGGSLFEKLSLLGGELILSTLEKLQNGTAVRTPGRAGHALRENVKEIYGTDRLVHGGRKDRASDPGVKPVAQRLYILKWKNRKDLGGGGGPGKRDRSSRTGCGFQGQPSGGDGKGSSFHQGAPAGGEKADGYSRFLKRLTGGGRYGPGSIRREEICIC